MIWDTIEFDLLREQKQRQRTFEELGIYDLEKEVEEIVGGYYG
jgi:hypothetical protein